MNISFEAVQNALKLGKEFLPRVGAFELAEILGITKTQMFALIDVNRSVFAVDDMKAINLTENTGDMFATTQESWAFFLRETCGGNEKLATYLQTRKAIASNIQNPIQWLGDFEYATFVRLDANKDGSGAKSGNLASEGKEVSDRTVCLGRVVGGGTTPDKWIFGVIPDESEIAIRIINNKHMYYHRWVQDDANRVKWVVPASSSFPASMSEASNRAEAVERVNKLVGGKKTTKARDEKVEVKVDVPGQQMLPGTDPKPVETSPPASIVVDTLPSPAVSAPMPPPTGQIFDLSKKPPVAQSATPAAERPPMAQAAASIKADIKSRAIEEQAAAGNTAPVTERPPLAQAIASIPSTPKAEIEVPPATTASATAPDPSNAMEALSLLDNLMTKAGQKG